LTVAEISMDRLGIVPEGNPPSKGRAS